MLYDYLAELLMIGFCVGVICAISIINRIRKDIKKGVIKWQK